MGGLVGGLVGAGIPEIEGMRYAGLGLLVAPILLTRKQRRNAGSSRREPFRFDSFR